MEAKTGRIVAMASQPTYDPAVWVGGITKKQLARLYSEKAGDAAARPGHPGPVRARLDVEADHDRRRAQQRLLARHPARLLLGLPGRQPLVQELRVRRPTGYIGFARRSQLSCDTFFYRVGYHFWQKYGSDPTDVHAKDPLVEEAKNFGFGSETGIDLPGEASPAGSPTGTGSSRTGSRMKDYYCAHRTASGTAPRPATSCTLFAHEFCLEGSYYRAGDAVNFSIGQGDTIVTPLQLARALRRALQRRHALRSRGSPRRSSAPTARCSSGSRRR